MFETDSIRVTNAMKRGNQYSRVCADLRGIGTLVLCTLGDKGASASDGVGMKSFYPSASDRTHSIPDRPECSVRLNVDSGCHLLHP
jgi:hypothetical protein